MNESAGIRKQVAGSLKEAIGKVAGDAELQAEGATQKKQGQVQRDTEAPATKAARD